MQRINRTALLIFIVVVLAGSTMAGSLINYHKYYLGFEGGFRALASGDNGKYPFQNSIGLTLGFLPTDRWQFSISYENGSLTNDTVAESSLSFSRNDQYATMKFDYNRYRLGFSRRLFDSDRRLNLLAGLGIGIVAWQIKDPVTDTLIHVPGEKQQTLDFRADELFFSGSLGLEFSFGKRAGLLIATEASYLTGAGVEFDPVVESSRDSWMIGIGATLRVFLGSAKSEWKSDKIWSAPTTVKKEFTSISNDSDGDGVIDNRDKCPATPVGVAVDSDGCPRDSDGDGVDDGSDHCPATDRRAIGAVDIFGCPVDSDFDAIPDYLDHCPGNQLGAMVDKDGCPIDSDADGIPDGLDDCPHTLVGVDVDQFGCIDLAMLAKPIVLYIDYVPGSFEVDPRNRERLQRLGRLLNFVTDVKMKITGYTDNIGTPVANKSLSLKRARRVGDFLAMQGIAPERIETFGKGETDFIASNDTSAGRNKNRRVVINFHK